MFSWAGAMRRPQPGELGRISGSLRGPVERPMCAVPTVSSHSDIDNLDRWNTKPSDGNGEADVARLGVGKREVQWKVQRVEGNGWKQVKN